MHFESKRVLKLLINLHNDTIMTPINRVNIFDIAYK